jgi:MFS family permease
MYSLTFVMPFYLMDGRGLSPSTAGLFLTIQPFLMAISAPISGTLSDRIGSRLLSTIGMGIIGVGLLLLAALKGIDPIAQLLLYLAIIGLGIGVFIVPNTNALMGSAPRNRQGIASGILATARNVGMVLGVGISGAVFTSIRTQNLANGPSQAVMIGSHASFLVAAVIAGIGMLISASRGKKTGAGQFEQTPGPNSRPD